MRRVTQYLVSVPERILRAVAAALGGTIHETAELVLPRLVRKSRFYEATAKNLLRITVELVGGVERERESVEDEHESSPKKLAVRKAGGNVVELGSILAFGFSPLWLLAGAADVTSGTRVYLDALVSRAQGRRRARKGGGVRIGRRPARVARGSERHDRASDRHPAARDRRAEALARGPPHGRAGAPDSAGARGRVPGPARRGRSRAALAPRGLGRHRVSRSSTPLGRSAASTSSIRTPKICSPCGTKASPRTHAASAALRDGGRSPLRSSKQDSHGAWPRPARPDQPGETA